MTERELKRIETAVKMRYGRDLGNCMKDMEALCDALREAWSTIEELQWRVENPGANRVGDPIQ